MTTNWVQFEDYVSSVMEEKGIAGVSVGISKGRKIIYEQGFGYRDISTKNPVTPETIFGIASITKSFTAVAIMQLAEQGFLCVSDPVIEHIPVFKLKGIDDMNKIEIHHLLSHTTGCPPLERREDLKVLDEHLEYLSSSDYKPLGNPGEFFSYCNDTFLLLGAIIERVTGKLFRRYVTENILNPLNMYRSTLSIEEVEKYNDVSVPYDYNTDKKGLEEKPWPTLGNYEVGGGIRSCARDLLKYGNFYIRALNNSPIQIITKSSIEKMFQPAYEIGDNSHYGYALKTTYNYHGVTLVEHGGGQPGVSSNFGFIPEKEVVVTVLSNVGAVPIRKIWLAAVNTVLGLPPEIKIDKKETFPLEKSRLEFFVGTYKSEEGSSFTVELHNDSLIAKIGSQSYTLRPGSIDTLLLEKEDRPIKFFLTEDGYPWAAFWGMRMLRKQ